MPRLRERSSCADKHDGLGWQAGFAVRAEGKDPGQGLGSLLIGFRSNQRGLLPHFRSLLPPHWVEVEAEEVDLLYSFREGGETRRRGVRNYHLTYVGCTQVGRSLDREESLRSFQELIYGQTLLRLPLPSALVIFKASLMADSERVIAVVGQAADRERLVLKLEERGLKLLACPLALLDAEGRMAAMFSNLLGFPGPLTDLVFIDQAQGGFSPGRAALSLFTQAYANNGADHLIEVLARAVQAVRLHRISSDDQAETLKL